MANFQVDTRLAVLLGESYTSTERALKELVDNGWDADAENIWITLPAPMTLDPIIIGDDGSGMTEQELRSEYLFIANDRRSRKGELTANKRRKVKGRKGVGKFAGLCAAQIMSVATRARRHQTTITIDRKALQAAGNDIENIPLGVDSVACPTEEHGTTITLSELDQNLHFPSPEKFRALLMRDYGREEGIAIHVNGKRLDMDDVGGSVTVHSIEMDGIGRSELRFTVAAEKSKIKGAGIIVRVNGKAVGRPTFLGLDEAEDFPKALLGQIYGEIEADGLENEVTADFASITENSKGYERVKEWAAPLVRAEVAAIYGREMQLAQARLKQKINRRLSEMPEHKRTFAEGALNKILHKFYGEGEDKLEPIVNVVLDALERDDYRMILEELDRTNHADVAFIAAALEQFGLVDLAAMAQQARQRLRLIDYLETLAATDGTVELVMHKAIEQNLWILGSDHGLLASNRSLKKIVVEAVGATYTGARAAERPDLLLTSNVTNQHVLIEFKSPSLKLKFENYQQATRYRHELNEYLPNNIEVIVIGGTLDANVLPANREPYVKISTYVAIFSRARNEIEWLIKQLSAE